MSLPRPNPVRWIEREKYIDAFETAFAADSDADFAAFIPPAGHPLRLQVLEELVRIDLEHHWRRNQPRWLEDYFHRFPELFDVSAAVRTLAFEEFRLRRRAGQAVSAEEYRRRFGIDPTRGIREDLPEGSFEAATPKPPPDRFAQVLADLPRVGDEILGYRLTAELGSGAFGNVFLAHSLRSGQPVAVKVAPQIAGESPTHARLRHRNIMPVFKVGRSRGVQAIVMPYRGAVTLAHAQSRFHSDTIPVAGAALFDVTRTGLPRADSRSPIRRQLARSSYFDAALWLIARLADGLAYAHSRRLLHRDLKPANVLLADDGTPMLLDFNAASELRRDDQPTGPGPCGTLPYMSPEQLDEFLGNARVVDARADLYSLGTILFQLLTGRMPYPSPHDLTQERLASTLLLRLRPAPLVRTLNPAAPEAAESLARRLLEPDPDRRPAGAAAVRDEIDALTTHMPRANSNWRDRLNGWLRR